MSLSLDSRNAHQIPAPSLYVKFEAENKQGLVGLRKGESKKIIVYWIWEKKDNMYF